VAYVLPQDEELVSIVDSGVQRRALEHRGVCTSWLASLNAGQREWMFMCGGWNLLLWVPSDMCMYICMCM